MSGTAWRVRWWWKPMWAIRGEMQKDDSKNDSGGKRMTALDENEPWRRAGAQIVSAWEGPYSGRWFGFGYTVLDGSGDPVILENNTTKEEIALALFAVRREFDSGTFIYKGKIDLP
jgi:hypothetical protein